VTSDAPIVVDTESLVAPLVITKAVLVGGSDSVISIKIHDEKYVLGTLYKDKKNSLNLEVRFWDLAPESYEISITGKGAKVDLTGYFHPPDLEGGESGDSSDSDLGVVVEDVTAQEAEEAIAKSEHLLKGKKKGGKPEEKKLEEKKGGKPEEKKGGKPEEKKGGKPAAPVTPPSGANNDKKRKASLESSPAENSAKKQNTGGKNKPRNKQK